MVRDCNLRSFRERLQLAHTATIAVLGTISPFRSATDGFFYV